MVKLIAHRGNIDGPDAWNENRPSHIQKALDLGFDVEVDVWCNVLDGVIHQSKEPKLFLGHDTGKYPVTVEFLENPRIWCHAKNQEAFLHLIDTEANVFWVKDDGIAYTTHGYVWTDCSQISSLPNDRFNSDDIVHVDLDGTRILAHLPYQPMNKLGKFSVCSDYVGRLKELIYGEQ